MYTTFVNYKVPTQGTELSWNGIGERRSNDLHVTMCSNG